MGDKGVKEIVASGILARLKVLDLRHGCVSDKGAEMIAEVPRREEAGTAGPDGQHPDRRRASRR